MFGLKLLNFLGEARITVNTEARKFRRAPSPSQPDQGPRGLEQIDAFSLGPRVSASPTRAKRNYAHHMRVLPLLFAFSACSGGSPPTASDQDTDTSQSAGDSGYDGGASTSADAGQDADTEADADAATSDDADPGRDAATSDGGGRDTDTDAATNDDAGGTEFPPTGELLITELMADNGNTIEDEVLGSPDWVELYNPGPEAVDLAGWTLTDDPDAVDLDDFSDAVLGAGEFLVLLATGEATTGLAFKLKSAGEEVILRDASGALVDRVSFGAQRRDVSWGRPQDVSSQVLLDDGDEARLTAGAPSAWAEPDTDDATWGTVVLPVGTDSRTDDAENVALLGVATQSTDFSSSYPASSALDDEWSTFTHTATGDFTPWWQVDLGDTATLTDIVLLNRLGCCPERLYNVTVEILDADERTIWTSTLLNAVPTDGTPTSPGDTLDAGLDEVVRGRFVRVSKEAVGGTYESEWLTLAEVQVMGLWAPPYASWIASDIGAELDAGSGEVVLRVPVFALDAPPSRLRLEVRADDAFEATWDTVTVASANLDALDDVDVGEPVAFYLDPTLTTAGGLLAVRLVDVGGDDAFLGLRLVAQDINTDIAAEATVYFPEPTPGEPNGQGFAGFVDAPTTDQARGWLDGPTTVTLSTETAGASMVYTLDGTVPSAENGTRVDAARGTLDVDGTTTLRAIAVLEGWADSPVTTVTWLDMDEVLRQPTAPLGMPDTWDAVSQSAIAGDYEMDPEVVEDPAYSEDIVTGLRAIPVLSLVLPHDDLWDASTGIYINSTERGAAWERATSMEIVEPDGSSFHGDCGVRIHGYGWRPHSNTMKHSFRLEFRRDYGEPKLEYPLFPDAPVDRFDSIVLRSQGSRGWQDFRDPEQAQYIRDAFARDTALAMGKADGHAAYVHLFLNGLYWGLYMAVERPDADFGAEYFGGDADEYDAINRRTSTNEAIDGDLEAYNRLVALADEDLTVQANYDAVAALVDVDDLIDYMLIHQFTSNRDGPERFSHNNMRGVRRRVAGERFRFFVWDMEYSLWNAEDNVNIDVDVPGSASHVYAQLRTNEDFRRRYAERAAAHLGAGGALSADEASARYEARAEEVFDAVVAESARWGDTDREVPYTRDVEWAEERRRLTEEYFPYRTSSLVNQLREAGLY